MATKKLLILNAGSSSLKFKLFDLVKGANPLKAVATGLCERLGDESNSQMKAKSIGSPSSKDMDANTVVKSPMKDHTSALQLVAKYLEDTFTPAVHDNVKAVGHRVVHGLDINQPVLITPSLIAKVESASALAPLHNPPNLQGIQAATEAFPHVPQVAVFDTAFHQSMSPDAYMYALPYELYEKQSIRRYGFHGQSYTYLTEEAARLLNKPQDQLNAVLLHLGAGSSMCAVQNGKSIDSTMGMTPLEGLMMGSRCGDIDGGVVIHLAKQMALADVDTLVNKKSGFVGLAGNVDVRMAIEGANKGDERCKLALQVYTRRVRKYLGAFFLHLGGKVDAIVFSAGIGENSTYIREHVCKDLEWLGVELDPVKNEAAVGLATGVEIQSSRSQVKVLVIPTDEELSIARQTLQVLKRDGNYL